MPKSETGSEHNPKKRRLKKQIDESEETLRAIGMNLVDAFVVTRENAIRVVTLSDADFPYRTMVESMNEGAVTVIPDGTIFYSNPCFARMVHRDPKELIGVHFQQLLTDDQQQFNRMLQQAGEGELRGEFCLGSGVNECIPVQLSFYSLRVEDANGIAIIATDITERMRAEEKIRSLASELAIAEQEERHRISQILHDDLQQRLFALRAQLTFTLDSLKGNSPSRDTQDTIDQIHGWLSEAITITRNLSVDISPSVLQGEGIVEAIHWLAARMKEQHNLQVEIHATDDFSALPDHLRVTLFQATRELLFNIVKHAGVLQADIHLEKLEGHGHIVVSDSGNGFDAKTVLADSQAAHGLMIVRDRLNLMGGSLDVESASGNGTRARIAFPISASVK